MATQAEIELFYYHLNSLNKALVTNDTTNLFEDIAFFNEECQFDKDDNHSLYMLLQQYNPLTNFEQLYNDNNKEIYEILFQQLQNIPYKEGVKWRYDFFLIRRAQDKQQLTILANNLFNHRYDNNLNFEFIKFNIGSLCLFFEDFSLYEQVLNYSKE